MKIIFCLLAGLFVSTAVAGDSGKMVHRCDGGNWTSWGNEVQLIIEKKPESVSFSRPAGAKPGWTTPIYKFRDMPVVTAFTALKFSCKGDRVGSFEININNDADGAQYAARFNIASDKWIENTVLIKDAVYKRGGKPGIVPSGFLGSSLQQIQIAYSGKMIELKDVEIVELDPMHVPASKPQPEFITDYLKNRKEGDYRVFRRNAVFPVGVISTIRAANRDNGEYFGQTTLERMEDDLRQIRQLGFNTYSNFTDASGLSITERLKLMRKYHLYLLETSTHSTALHTLPDDAKLIREIAANADHPNLLAWYGQDEPTNGAIYLKNKSRIENLSGYKVPVTSAMHMLSVAQELGPAMDVITIDPYSLVAGSKPEQAANTLETHGTMIQLTRNFCAGKRVWMIPQAFSMRNSGSRTLRYPSPAEAQFDVFNALGSGANGFIYFIYNDMVPYLDGKIRGEEFDQTMVDAWGNGNPTTEALGAIAKRLTAIMPSFIERKPVDNTRNIKLPESWKAAQWQTEDGILLIVINRDLFKENRARISVELHAGEKLYDLDLLKENSELELQPGNAAMLLIANPDKWPRVKEEIQGRLDKHAQEIESLKEEFPAELLAIQKVFGDINAMLVAPGTIERVDVKPEWEGFREKMKALSKDYFTARREWRQNGKTTVNLTDLRREVEKLLNEAKAKS